MAREDIKLIIEAERKAAEGQIQQLKNQHELEIHELKLEHQHYRQRRDAMDWIWTGIFITLMVLIVTVLT